EAFNEQIRALSPSMIARDAMRALDLVTGRGRNGVTGIGFLEIASQGEEAQALRDMLSALGFVATHKNKTADITLLRQGEIRVLINEMQEGLAHSFYLMQGTCV